MVVGLGQLPPIAFLGGGQMGEAFVRGLLRAELVAPGAVWLSDIRPGRADHLAAELGLHASASNLDAVSQAELILLSVKPQDVPALLDEIGADVRSDQLVVSIAAGVWIAPPPAGHSGHAQHASPGAERHGGAGAGRPCPAGARRGRVAAVWR